MTQRIFDTGKEQDVKDLFALFPDEVQKIMPASIGFAGIYDKNDKHLETIPWLRIHWSKTEVVRPVVESQWIGCLCWFWDKNDQPFIAVLKRVESDATYKYITTDGEYYKCCRPVRRDEIKFVEDVE